MIQPLAIEIDDGAQIDSLIPHALISTAYVKITVESNNLINCTAHNGETALRI